MTTRRAALAFALTVWGVLGAQGCVDNRASMQIQAVCLPTDDCTFSETCDAQYIGFPTLDVSASASDALWLFLQVENQSPDNTDVTVGRANTNDAHIDEAVIEYDGPALPEAVVGSNYLVPAGGTAVVSVEVIPQALGAGAALTTYASAGTREMVARIRLRGYYDSGARFETGEFPVTIRICSGCLTLFLCGSPRTCPPDSDGQLPLTCAP